MAGVLGNRGNRGPRPWNLRPWDAAEWHRLREAWASTGPAPAEDRFWAAVASSMGTNRSPAAVGRRAEQRGLRAKVGDSMNPES